MGSMSSSKPSIGNYMPTLREGHGSTGNGGGIQQAITVPLGPAKLVDGATYKGVLFVAPADGCQIKRLDLSAAVALAGGTNTLALDNYDASANASRNPLSTATVNPATLTAKEGTRLTLGADANLILDQGDTLSYTLVCGTMTTDGEGYALSAVIIVLTWRCAIILHP